MANGVNANLARRWVLDAERRSGGALIRAANGVVPSGFMPVQLPPAEAAPVDIHIELRRGRTAVSVSWPQSAASQYAAWMRELLR